MMTKQVNTVPSLRFPEFGGEWNDFILGESLIKVVDNRGKTPPLVSCGIPLIEANVIGNRYVNYADVKKFVSEFTYSDWFRGHLEKGDILFTTVGATALCSYYDAEVQAAIAQNVVALRFGEDYPTFMYYLLSEPKNNHKFKKIEMGAVQPSVKVSQMICLSFKKTSKLEQQKIADFLTAVDKRIEQLEEKKRLLTEYKKGVMQQIFSQQIRFKDDNGNPYPDWQEKRLGDVFQRVKTKNVENNLNVMTISAQQGLINQEEYFNKSVSAKDVRGYYLLHKNDFAYNKSYSKGYPMGALKRLTRYEKGVVSTLYICFNIKDESLCEFYEHYFDSGFLNRELSKIAQEGARNHGLLNMSVVEFFNAIVIPKPTVEEQQKIADFLTSIDNKTENVAAQLEQAKTFKKGLLQQMFV